MREEMDIPMPAMAPGGSSYRVARGRAAIDPNTKRLAIIAGSIGGALTLLVGGWSLTSHRHAGVPVIEADSRPLRVKPENAGGLQVAGQNESILSGDADTKAALAPPPEAPAPQALKAQEKQAAAAAAASAAAALAAAVPPAAPRLPAIVATAPVVHAPTASPVQAVSLSQPVDTKAKPAAKPTPAPSATASAGSRASSVQLAALPTEQAAMAEWQRLEKRMPDVLGGRKPGVVKYEHDGKTFWRLRTGGFADAADAASFCGRLKSKGQACTVASS